MENQIFFLPLQYINATAILNNNNHFFCRSVLLFSYMISDQDLRYIFLFKKNKLKKMAVFKYPPEDFNSISN